MTIRPRRSLSDTTLRRPHAVDSVPRDTACLWLDKNENLDPELMALSGEILASIPNSILATYPEAGELYRKLGNSLGVGADSLLLTPGSDGAIRLVFEAFVEHGDAVVYTNPTFAMYPVYSQMFGACAIPIEYQPSAAGPVLDPKKLIGTLQEHKPKLLCLPNPDSPTGTVLEPDVLREILLACESAGTVLLIDEAYHPFYEWTAVPWVTQSRNLVVARTFAKAWGVAGLRIGYTVGHPDTIALIHKMRPMYEVSTLATEFMARMLDHELAMRKSVERIIQGKRFFVEEMRGCGFNVLPSAGNFLHVAFCEQGNAVHAALTSKVLYRAGFEQPCLAGYSRFSVATRPIMEKVANLIKQAVGKSS